MAILNKIRERIINEIDGVKNDAIKMADYIFDNPEVSEKEFNTQKFLVDKLEKNGFKVETGSGGLETAFRAEFDFKKSGPAVAFIAEYDALPEIGHACHHHIIASSAINTAVALSKLDGMLRGRIVVVGTPAEELNEAKKVMIENGALKGLDIALMFHGGCKNSTRLIVLAVEYLKFTFKGKASHAAAAPHEGINALDAVIMLFNSINALRQQLKDDVRIHGNIVDGGKVINLIPETSSAIFWIRSQSKKYLDKVVKKVKDCARGAALQTGADLEISKLQEGGVDLLENKALIEEFKKNFKSLGGDFDSRPCVLGSSDIGNLSYVIPVIHPMVKTSGDDCALHTVEFLKYGKSGKAHDGMILGMKAMALTAARAFLDDGFIKSVKSDFDLALKKSKD